MLAWVRRASASGQILFALILLAIAYLVLVPLVTIIIGALTTSRPGAPIDGLTLEVLAGSYGSSRLWSASLTTFVYAMGVVLVAVPCGTFLAWVVERTDTPLRNVLLLLAVMRLIVPGLLLTLSWILLLGPNAGYINVWAGNLLGLDEPLINVFSLPGMIFVEGMMSAPVSFLLMSAAFRSMDPSLEEAARASGASIMGSIRRVTIPLAKPALLAAVLITFVTAFEGLETPLLIGRAIQPDPLSTLSTEIYLNVASSPSDFNAASAYAVLFVAVAMVGVYFYRRQMRQSERFATVTGKGFRPNRTKLGRWRWVTMLASFALVGMMFALPMAAITWRSFMPYNGAPSMETLGQLSMVNWEFLAGYSEMWTGLKNSLIVAAIAATAVMGVTAVAAWIVTRSKVRGRGLLDGLVFIPIALPGLVVGLALLTFTLSYTKFLYGTLLLIAIAHMTRTLPYGMRFSSASMVQIHAELEGAAHASGATWPQTFRRITLPLLLPGLIGGFIFIFLASVRELSASILLYGLDSFTYPVALFNVTIDGSYGTASAMAVLGVAVLGTIVLLVRFVGGKFGVRT